MNELVRFAGKPALTRNSLILIGPAFRTFAAVVSICVAPVAAFFHETLPTRSPLKAAGPDVTLNVALTSSPGATGSAIVIEVFVVPWTTDVHRVFGRTTLSVTPVAGAPVVFVNVTVVSCEEPGANVCNPGGLATAEAGAIISRATSYFAATTFAWMSWSVASVGKVPAAVIAPS